MSFKIDTSKFKHVSSDKNSMTMQHEDGHILKIATSSLSPKLKAQLAEIVKESKPVQHFKDGGMPKAEPIDEKFTSVDLPEAPAAEVDLPAAAPQAAEPMAAAMPPVNPNEKYQSLYQNTYDLQKQLNPGQPDEMLRDTALVSAESAKEGDEAKAQWAQKDLAQQAQQGAAENQRRESLGLAPIAGAPGPGEPISAPSSAIAKAPVSNAPMEAAAPKVDSSDPFSQGITEAKNAEDMRAKALSDLGGAQSKQYGQAISEQEQALLNSQDALKHINNESASIVSDLKNNHINPNHYLENMSAGGKIATAVGFILSGIGSGITGQPNLAVQFLNSQIERDLSAQKMNMDKQHNLLSALNQQYGNTVLGENMFRVARSEMLKNQIDQAAAQNANPLAQAAAAKAKAEIDMKYGPIKAAMAAMMGTKAASPSESMDNRLQMLRMINPEMAKSLESRYIPNVGVASVPVPEKVRGDIIANKNLIDAVRDFRGWATKNSGSLSPAVIAEGKAKANLLQQKFREGAGLGVWKESEAPLLSGVIPDDPTAFFNKARVDPKLRALEQDTLGRLNTVKSQYGLPLEAAPKMHPNQEAFLAWAKQHPDTPEAKSIFKKLGAVQ